MPIYNNTFALGAGPQATFAWTATETEDNEGNWYVQLTCKYGGGTAQDNSAQTDPIPWGDNQSYQVYENQNDPYITVTGTVLVNFDPNGGDDFAALFTGAMTLSANDTNQLTADQVIVASAVIDANA